MNADNDEVNDGGDVEGGDDGTAVVALTGVVGLEQGVQEKLCFSIIHSNQSLGALNLMRLGLGSNEGQRKREKISNSGPENHKSLRWISTGSHPVCGQ